MAFSTKVGAIELRGRFSGCTRLATRLPSASRSVNEKSVNWLLSKKPRTICRLPKPFSIVVVMEIALPLRSTIDMWLVDGRFSEVSVPAVLAPEGMPATGVPMVFVMLMSLERAVR